MIWKVPLVDIDIGKPERTAVLNVLKSKWLTMGEVTASFEKKFADYLGAKHALAVSSGTAALHLALLSLGIGPEDEVIVPSFTFVASVNSIIYTGAKPVFADIESQDDLNISPDDVENKITPKTKAVLVVHYGGNPCQMDKIIEIAKNHNLKIVEDAAHAPGGVFKSRKLGTIGDVSAFSLFSNKNICTGEGGMVVTDDDDLDNKARKMRSHGMTTVTLDRHLGRAFGYEVVCLGYNYRIDEMRSALGIVQLNKLDKNNEKRRNLVKYYIKKLKKSKILTVPFINSINESSCHIFSVILKNSEMRQSFMEYLKKKGIQTSLHYFPVHLFKYYKQHFGYQSGLLPLTENVSTRQVTLPLYSNLKKKDIDYIVRAIKRYENLLHR